jgi:hypothetical protein
MTTPSRTLVHTTEIAIRWCDMDAFGHVNNSVYFSYFEVARIEWWNKIIPANVLFRNPFSILKHSPCHCSLAPQDEAVMNVSTKSPLKRMLTLSMRKV